MNSPLPSTPPHAGPSLEPFPIRLSFVAPLPLVFVFKVTLFLFFVVIPPLPTHSEMAEGGIKLVLFTHVFFMLCALVVTWLLGLFFLLPSVFLLFCAETGASVLHVHLLLCFFSLAVFLLCFPRVQSTNLLFSLLKRCNLRKRWKRLRFCSIVHPFFLLASPPFFPFPVETATTS